MVRHALLFATLLLFGATGCNTGASSVPGSLSAGDETVQAPDAAAIGLPALSELPDAQRTVSAGGSIVKSPIDFWFTSGGTDWDADLMRLRLFPLPDEYQFMIYEYNIGTGGAEPAMILARAEFDGGADNNLYMALANYSTNSWEFFPTPTGIDLPQPHLIPQNPADYVSPGGNVYMALVVYNASSFYLYDTELYLNLPAMPPPYIDATDGTRYLTVDLSWPRVDGAISYEIDYREWDLEGDWMPLITVSAGLDEIQSYQHTATEPPGKGAFYDLRYAYRVRSVFDAAGKSPLWSESDTGYRTVPVPQNVHAQYHCTTQYIEITWDAIPGINSYIAYRDGEEYQTLADNELLDSGIFDFDEHEYYIRASAIEGSSLPSETVVGRVMGIDLSSLVSSNQAIRRGPFDLAVANGKPFAVCGESDLRRIRFAYATNDEPAGQPDWVTGLIVGGDGEPVGTYYDPRLVVSQGVPIVFFYEKRATRSLKCAIATSIVPTGPEDWTVYTLHSGADEYYGHATRLVDGMPALAVMARNEVSDLHYFRALTELPQSGGDWDSSVINFGDLLGPVDICEVDGRAAVCYTTGDTLTYQHADSTTPEDFTDWGLIAMPNSPNSGEYYSMAIIDGRPAIAYRRFQGLEYVFSTEAVPTDSADWLYSMRNFSTPHGEFASLAEVGGKPAIANYLADGESLTMVIACEAPTADNYGDDLWLMNGIDANDSFCGLGCSMAVLNGLPVFMYSAEDATIVDNDWRFARGY